MAEKPWHYLVNSFQAATKENYKRADVVGLFTNNVLNGVPPGEADLVALKTYFQPKYAIYKATYEAWKALGGTEKGLTQSLKNVEELINEDVNDWEYTIMGTHKKGSPGYMTLFPNGISGLKRGTRGERITALNNFSTQLTQVGGLAPVKAEVDARITQLQGANMAQDETQGEQTTDSSAVEAARIVLCKNLYYVLGGLMMHYADTPDAIAGYFDLETLRAKPQTEFTGSINAGDTKFIVKRKLEADEDVRIRNTGEDELVFYFAPTKTTPLTAQMAQQPVQPGADITVDAVALGASATNVYLLVHNGPLFAEGHWTVEI